MPRYLSFFLLFFFPHTTPLMLCVYLQTFEDSLHQEEEDFLGIPMGRMKLIQDFDNHLCVNWIETFQIEAYGTPAKASLSMPLIVT